MSSRKKTKTVFIRRYAAGKKKKKNIDNHISIYMRFSYKRLILRNYFYKKKKINN